MMPQTAPESFFELLHAQIPHLCVTLLTNQNVPINSWTDLLKPLAFAHFLRPESTAQLGQALMPQIPSEFAAIAAPAKAADCQDEPTCKKAAPSKHKYIRDQTSAETGHDAPHCQNQCQSLHPQSLQL